LVEREAENPKVLCSNPDFDRFLGTANSALEAPLILGRKQIGITLDRVLQFTMAGSLDVRFAALGLEVGATGGAKVTYSKGGRCVRDPRRGHVSFRNVILSFPPPLPHSDRGPRFECFQRTDAPSPRCRTTCVVDKGNGVAIRVGERNTQHTQKSAITSEERNTQHKLKLANTTRRGRHVRRFFCARCRRTGHLASNRYIRRRAVV